MSLFSGIRDLGIKHLLSNVYGRYGTVLDIKINSNEKQIRLSAMLLGEKEPIDVFIDGYSISESFGVAYFQPNKVTLSREWLTVLASELIVGKMFALPSGVSEAIAKTVL